MKNINNQFAFLSVFRKPLESFGLDYTKLLEVLNLKAQILVRMEALALPVNAQALKNKQDKIDAQNKKAELSGKPLKPVKQAQPAGDASLFSVKRNLQTLILSFFMAIMSMMFSNPATMLTIIFLPGFVLQFLRVTTSFPVLVLDTRDLGLLATLPIDSRTLAGAKTILLFSYLLTETLMTYGFGIIPFIIKGYFGVLPGMILAIFFANTSAIILVYLLYGLVLRFYDGEKLKDLISFLQIILGIIIVIGYQILSRMMSIVSPAAAVDFAWWHLLVPPLDLVWLANAGTSFEALRLGLYALVALLLPILIHFTLTAKLVEENMVKLSRDGEQKRRFRYLRIKLRTFFTKLVFRDEQSRAFYEFSSSISDNDRKVKQTMYPFIVSIMLTPVILVFSVWQGVKQPLDVLLASAPLLVLSWYVYTLSLAPMVVMYKKCEQPAGSWFFEVLPLVEKARAVRAAGLVFLLRYMFVPMVVLSLILLILVGKSWAIVLPHLVLANIFNVLVGFIQLHIFEFDWPHSKNLLATEPKAGRKFFIIAGIAVVLALLHLACAIWLGPLGLWLLSGLGIIGIGLAWIQFKEENPSI